jgi:hypothetical protein
MSENKEENMNVENKIKIMTGFIYYNKAEDLTELFETLNEFRKNYGLKYSHQKFSSKIYFNINSEHLGTLYKEKQFQISRFQTKSEYKCEKKTADKLMRQRDSFIRMDWNDETDTLTFMSRTESKHHSNLVKRIFKDSKITIDMSNYQVLRDYLKNTKNNKKDDDDEEDDNDDDDDNEDHLDNQDDNNNEDNNEAENEDNNEVENVQVVNKTKAKHFETKSKKIVKETDELQTPTKENKPLKKITKKSTSVCL